MTHRRLARLEATREIRSLHATLGAAVARGDVRTAAACFTDDGDLEIANEGRFIGRERVAVALSHLLGLNDGGAADSRGGDGASDAAAPGNQPPHAADDLPGTALFAQIMPIIEVDVEAHQAHAVWRIFDIGARLGEAYLAEGPALVRYVHGEQGWRIRSLRWLRGLRVPFEGGWQVHATSAPPAPVPDAQTAELTPVWPEVAPRGFALPRTHDVPASPTASADEFSGGDLDDAAARVAELEAVREVEALILELAYDAERAEWTRCTDRFDDDVDLSFGGVHLHGRLQALETLLRLSPESDLTGRLLEIIVFEPDVTINGDHARAAFRFLTKWAVHGSWHELGMGACTAEVRQDEHGWRVLALACTDAKFTSYDEGWAREQTRRSRLFAPLDGASDTPDESPAPVATTTTTPPTFSDLRATTKATSSENPSRVDIERSIDRLESRLEIEQTQMRYGYDLIDLDWDDLASLFTEDGTIEIALRGVYVGRDSVRRSLHLYGDGPTPGVLHTHLQFQPLVRLHADGEGADVRARALSMLGTHGSMAMWSGGRYANVFVRDTDCRWRFACDRIVNRYFAPYETGWKQLPERQPPGQSTTLLPDRPPTGSFELYPRDTD